MVKEIKADGGRAVAQQTDIGEEAAVEAMIDRAVESFGGLHILFNNAADTSLNAMMLDKPIHEMSVEWWDHAMRSTCVAPCSAAKHAIPHMIDGGGGSIVSTVVEPGSRRGPDPEPPTRAPRRVWCS